MRRRGTISWLTRTSRLPAALLSAAVIGGLVVSGLLLAADHRSEASEIRRLAAAVGPHRVTRARLTGGFAYAPCDTAVPNDLLVDGLVCRTAPPQQWPQYPQLSRLAGTMRTPSGSGLADASRRHASGSWSVIWQNPSTAVDELREAARLEPKNSAIQADLAAALLQRAELQQDPVSILAAYVASDSALALDPTRVEAMFNRALTLEQLRLPELARAQWTAYLARDGDSRWASEARERLATLDAPARGWPEAKKRLYHAIQVADVPGTETVVKQFPWHVRDEIRTAMATWAAAYNARDPRADSIAGVSLALARPLERMTHDRLWLDVANDIAAAGNEPDRTRAGRLANGLLAYDRGRSELSRLALDSAKVSLDEAHALLMGVRNAAAHLAAYDRARVAYQGHTAAAYDDATSRLRALIATTPPEYRTLRAVATRAIGFIGFVEGKLDVASSLLLSAIAQGAGLGEPDLELRTRTDAARLVAVLRGDSASWKEAYAAFKVLPSFPNLPRDAQRVFGTGAALTWRRFPTVARLFRAEVVRLTRTLGDSLLVASTLVREAEWLAQERRPEEALKLLSTAAAYRAGVHSDSIRAVMGADEDLVHGQVWLRSRPDSAVHLLRDVVDRYDETQYVAQAGRARLLLADAYVNAGKIDSARVAFDAALATIDEARAGLASTEDRARFLDEARPVIDSVLTFHLTRLDTLGALDFFERMRARVLLERSSQSAPDGNSRYRSVAAIRPGLDPATSIISYAVLDGEVVGWLVRRDGVWMRRVAASEPLEPLVDRFARLVESGADGPEIETASARLRDMLIAPFEARIPSGSSLVVIPDKWLHFVPFSALFDKRGKTFLAQTHELGVAPSIRLFADAALRSHALGLGSTPSVLAVGNPAFDRTVNSLPSLPGAEREAREVGKRYSRSRLLIGREATRRAFLNEAKEANVVHFAGHGVVRLDAPMLSQLVLAADSRDDDAGALYAKDLFAISLPATRLAILSGCRTASGGLSATEGVSSLARSLLAAGVPTVIASLWSVDDEATASFFAAYHDDFSRTGEAGGALHRTQVAWITRGEPWHTARTWAAFQLFGTVDVPRSRSAVSEIGGSRPSNKKPTHEMAKRHLGS